MVSKKSIVLCGLKDDRQKAVLSLECDGRTISGRVRLYNFSNEPNGIISLGITNGNNVIKAGLVKAGSMLYSLQTQGEKLPDVFSCAVINFVGGEPSPLLFGNSDGLSDKEKVLGSVISSLKGVPNMKEVEKVLDEANIKFDDEEEEIISQEIDKAFEEEPENYSDKFEEETEPKIQSEEVFQDGNYELEEDNEFDKGDCAHCKYKEHFYSECSGVSSQNKKQSAKNEEKELEESKADYVEEGDFYQDIKPQIDVLFKKNNPEEYLQDMIPGSKWVKVDFEDSGDYYVFGLIYEEESLKYICYGVPGVYQNEPPKQLSGYPVWFPLDKAKKEGFGYWLSYQDAGTGESIKAILD